MQNRGCRYPRTNGQSLLPSIWHTCEPSDRRINSPVFFRSSPDVKYPPEFSWLLHVPPVCSWLNKFTSQMCNLHHMHLDQGSKMQLEWHSCGILNPLHSAEGFYSHFKVCFNNFIYPPWVDYFTLGWWLFEYLLASTVNFKIYFIKIN